MGSCLGPTLANAFLCHYEKTWLNKCPSEFRPLVYRRYVDDIFVNYMNWKYNNIQCIFESEDSNNFSFLNVKITRKNERFVTSIFRKVTFSRVFTNYNSLIPTR